MVFTGSVPWEELPAHYAAGDVYAMPCRTRSRGLDVEGLGIVYLEASATGLPVIAGDSGGAPDAVREGETGYVVGGRDVRRARRPAVRAAGRPGAARAMGAAGRAWVETRVALGDPGRPPRRAAEGVAGRGVDEAARACGGWYAEMSSSRAKRLPCRSRSPS